MILRETNENIWGNQHFVLLFLYFSTCFTLEKIIKYLKYIYNYLQDFFPQFYPIGVYYKVWMSAHQEKRKTRRLTFLVGRIRYGERTRWKRSIHFFRGKYGSFSLSRSSFSHIRKTLTFHRSYQYITHDFCSICLS